MYWCESVFYILGARSRRLPHQQLITASIPLRGRTQQAQRERWKTWGADALSPKSASASSSSRYCQRCCEPDRIAQFLSRETDSFVRENYGGPGGIRTHDSRIKSPPAFSLYHVRATRKDRFCIWNRRRRCREDNRDRRHYSHFGRQNGDRSVNQRMTVNRVSDRVRTTKVVVVG